MSRNNSSKVSETDWERVDAMGDGEIDFSDLPELSEEWFKRATLRVGGQPVSKGKVDVHLQLSAWIVEYFKQQAGEEHYQALINEVLKQSIIQDEVRQLLPGLLGHRGQEPAEG